ncbi:MAG: class I SAM-dependent methyltransferase [Lewinella sp.]
MQDRHTNKRRYFDEQVVTTRRHVLPYVQEVMSISPSTRIFEIGSGEGGNLVPFLELGCPCVGVDFNQVKIDLGLGYIKEMLPGADIKMIVQDIYDSDAEALGKFDLIILRDVIEHIHDQGRFLKFVHKFLTPTGRIFFGFPPWRMPFGGHQQVLRHRLLNKLPWFHLLPNSAFAGLLRAAGEGEAKVEAMLEIKETGISIDKFTRLAEEAGFRFDRKDLWFINPNYETKFGLTPRKLPGIVDSVPWVKDFFSTCCYAVISSNQAPSS